MKRLYYTLSSIFIFILLALLVSVTPLQAEEGEWALTVDQHIMKLPVFVGLLETVWEKEVSPYGGEYDKIALHRLVRADLVQEGARPRAAVFILPGT